MTVVFDDTTIKGNEKLLMLTLADNCNDSGVCFPSWENIMRRTVMSKGSLAKWLISLEDKGLLFRVTRTRRNGSKTSNKFLLYPHQNRLILDDEDFDIFSHLFDQSSEVELPTKVQELNYQSSEVELPKGGQSSEVELLEPSLIINHHLLNHHSWREWVQYRGEIKKKLTPITVIKQKDMLCRYSVKIQADIINASIMNGWQGLFEPRNKSTQSQMSFKQQDKQIESQVIDYQLDNNIFDIIDEMEANKYETTKGVICE